MELMENVFVITYKPTMRLRWKCERHSNNGDTTSRVLEQMWQGDDGSANWKEVEDFYPDIDHLTRAEITE
jgi:hypothetical protein